MQANLSNKTFCTNHSQKIKFSKYMILNILNAQKYENNEAGLRSNHFN